MLSFSADLIKALKELETGEGDIEQTITIVPNPRAKRRGSMASYAFPELHSRYVYLNFIRLLKKLLFYLYTHPIYALIFS